MKTNKCFLLNAQQVSWDALCFEHTQNQDTKQDKLVLIIKKSHFVPSRRNCPCLWYNTQNYHYVNFRA